MKILAVDLGDVRTGLAICDSSEIICTPLKYVTGKSIFRVSEEIAQIAAETEAEEVVVGLPINMDGTEGPRASKCRKFADILEKDLNGNIPVVLWDERVTTVQAYKNLYDSNVYGRKTRELVDSEAARLILDNYLLYRKNRNE